MACNIKYNNRGEVEQVLTDQGTPSQLYAEAKKKVGEKEALDIFYVSQSEDFKATQVKPTTIVTNPLSSIKNFTEVLKNGTWGMLTGENPMAQQKTPEENAAHNEAAVKWLKEKGYNPIPIQGKYDNVENSFFVQGLTTEDALAFAREFDQDSVATDKGLVYQTGEMNPRVKGQEEIGGTFDNYYSTIRIKGEDLNYKVGYDFDTQEKVGLLTPTTSSNYANLTEDGKGNFVFYHRGGKGYETIRRSSGGTLATSREEGAALGKVGGVAMYYTKPTDTESMVSGGTTYMVKVPMEKVYDFNTDPLNLVSEAKALHAKEHPNKAFDANTQVAYITKLAGERGFDMVVSEWNGRTRAQTTKEFTPIDNQETSGNVVTKPFKNNYQSNTEKGYIASIPKAKVDSLQEVYKEIYKERNKQYKYDDLYRLAENFPKLSQEDITSMIMNSDLSEELKQKYQSILGTPEQRRESFKVQEPSLESVMKYITAQNEGNEPMNEEQTKDYNNALLSVKDFSLDKLKKAFYDENGVFFVSPSKLVKSGLYTQYEAEHLQKDLELQEQVKASIEALKNTADITPLKQEFDLLEKENEFTSFGKLNNLNPYIVQKQIQTELAATTREEFDEAVGDLPFSNFQKSIESEEAKDKLFNDMQAFKKAEVMLEVGGVIKPSLNANTEVVVPQVAQDLTGTAVLDKIKGFMRYDVHLLKTVLKSEAAILVKGIEEGLIAQGYDVEGLSAKAPDVYMMEYLSAVVDMSEAATKEALDEYVDVYNKYFEQDLSPEKGFLKTEQDDRNFVKLDTQLKEEDVYNQQNLIKQSEGVYIKVNPKTADELYPIVLTYPEKLPAGIKTEEELRKYVQSTLNNDEVTNTETGEAINLFKLYYGIPLEEVVKKEDTTDFAQKQAQFTGNKEYLTKDFVSDFYIKKLKEKAKGSELNRYLYRHFEVTEKGIELINNDPITLENMKPYIDEDLANYSLLSKSMPNLKAEEVETVDSKNSRRDMVVNYPSNVAKFDGNISILDNDTLITKNVNDEFIKLKNDVYENVETIGNLTLYTRLETPKSNFLNFNVEAPLANAKLEDYLHLDSKPEAFIKSKNYLTKEEKDRLSEDEFSCA